MRGVGLAAAVFLLSAGGAQAEKPVDPTAILIPGADDWFLENSTPERRGSCHAYSLAPPVLIFLIRAADGTPVFGAVSQAFTVKEGQPVAATLSIDGGAPIALPARGIAPLILARIEDPALVARLRAARAVDWTFPSGRYHAEIAGWGLAFDALKTC